MFTAKTTVIATMFFFSGLLVIARAEPERVELRGHVPAAVAQLTPKGRLTATNELHLAIGLPLRNEGELDELIHQLYDPASTNYHRFLTPPEFAARFGPTEADYQAVRQFAASSGLVVVGTHPNRVVLDVKGSVTAIEQAFHVQLHTYTHPLEARDFFAPDAEPQVDAGLAVLQVSGLDNYAMKRPRGTVRPLTAASLAVPHSGSGSGGTYMGNDFRAAYVPGTTLTGSGQSVALLQFDGYYSSDIASYISTAGIATSAVLTNVAVNGGVSTPGGGNDEVCLDIEMVLSMAPGVSKVIVYEAPNGSTSWSTLLSAIANDPNNTAKQISCSWGNSSPGGKDSTSEAIFKQMSAQGQSFFNATGDSDAFTSGIPFPSESTNITQVGGTTLSTTGAGGAWSSETAWNRGSGVGTSGGVSANYGIPTWQLGVSMTSNHGSTTKRNVPDVALTGENVLVAYNNGSYGTVGGTSCAAPLWAGFMALVNQQGAALGQSPIGFANYPIYAIGKSSCYNACFHDTTTGNNYTTASPTNFPAVAGFDLCTGWGTPTGTNLINALLWPPPTFTNQPAGKTVTNGASVTLAATAGSTTPMTYFWLFNGTNLPAGGNISGVTTNTLSINPAATNNSGSYQLVVSNNTGSVTSSVAVLTVGFPPAIVTPPTNLTLLTASTAVFSATAGGTPALAYQWKKNGTNFTGSGITGTNTSTLTLANITTGSAANYTLVVTNIFGAVTSSVVTLSVVLPPAITSSSLTNRTLQCGSNIAYSVTTSGTAPLSIQWSFDGSTIAGATNSTLSLADIHLPSHTVAVAVTNLYAAISSNAVLTVQDTLPPAITLIGGSRMTNELGSVFTDPGATAYDLCAGTVPVTVSGTVNTAIVGSNTLTYQANDGNGNTNTLTRIVIVRDTTPPAILRSFTNLVLAADSNCVAAMPDLTGTNFILATDLSGALTITQNPTNNFPLPLGTNSVVLTVADASGNQSYSTNWIAVLDQTPPVIVLNGANPMTTELGFAFADPGVIASDTCSGIALLTTNGAVNSNAIGTNLLTYTAVDGSGNTNSATRTVIVCDTTPPAILWSFTNLVLAADTNCTATMPDVTGTNFILATDLSDLAAVSQTPTNGAILLLGTNLVVIAVPDIFSNTAFSTNFVIVQDQTPPVILAQPQSQTNLGGADTSFSVAATACTPVAFQWFFNDAALTAQTGSTLTLSNLDPTAAGNYAVVVSASGGATTSAVATLTVNLLSPALALASSANPSGFNDDLNFTAMLTLSNATGTIQFLTNGTAFDSEPLAAGAAVSTNLSTLPRGTNLVTAIYSGGGNFLPATNSLAQIATNHPPVVAPVFYTLTAGLDLSIAVADLATNWSDADGDALFIAAIDTSTNGVTVTNGLPFLFYSNPNYVDDQFVCTISDGFGGTNYQTVSITIVPQTNSTPVIAAVAGQPLTGVTLQLQGGYGSTYILESTTDLFSGAWEPVATNTLGVAGVWQFTDFGVTNIPARFYRLKLAQ